MIGFVGAGRVGAQAALEVASQEIDDIVLVDIIEGLAYGEALDISHKISECGVDVSVKGSTDFSLLNGADVVVTTAGLARKPGMTRMDLLGKNAGIVSSVSKEVAKYAPDSIVITVTNPMDVMNYVVLKTTGFEKRRVVGMGGLLDLSRFKYIISQKLGVSRSSINALVIGEHGESMLPLARYTSIGGVPLSALLSETEIERTIDETRKIAIEVIAKKGATIDAPANAIAKMVKSIAWNKKEVLPASAYLEGEYGVSDLSIGVPIQLGRDGIEKIFELELNKEEKETFMKGVVAIKEAISSLPH
jgi:malate dehydrogenase